MSTVAPSSAARIERDHGRIRHPLVRLRKYINAYVIVEAIGLVALVLTLAFWVGFWLDFGVFKATGFDWVQSMGRTPSFVFRLVVLLAFAAAMLGMVAFVALTRFFKDFRDTALALILERRFPKILGDRLITAVELHNPKMAARYGYSADL